MSLVIDDHPIDPRYRTEELAASTVTADDVLALWEAEGAVPAEEALRRVHEVLVVATTVEEGTLVGVTTAYLKRSPQLRLDLWFLRTFVAAGHRLGNVAVELTVHAINVLEGRHLAGEDTRAAGIGYEVENAGLKAVGDAIWGGDFAYLGDTDYGAHLRVRYFPGDVVPVP